MNGTSLTLGLVGALALAGTVRRGSRSRVGATRQGGLRPGEARRFNAIYKSLQDTIRGVVEAYETGFGTGGCCDDMLAYEEISNWLANVGLPVLGEGAFRWVFDLGDGRVLKLEKGLGQIEDYDGDEISTWNADPSTSSLTEAERWRLASPAQREHLVPVLAFDPKGRWIIMPKVVPLLQGLDSDADLDAYVKERDRRMARRPEKVKQVHRVAKSMGITRQQVRGDNLDKDFRLLDYGDPR